MPAIVVVGTQWGDEGKGKFTDLLAIDATHVVRYQGGHNAGHTLVVDGVTFKLQLVPSGILYPHVVPVIANGVVVDPWVLLRELDMLEAKGIDVSKLVVSGNAHLILPYHQEIDTLNEAALGDSKIGTTLRGIGPAYADKADRVGIRVQDLLRPAYLKERISAVARGLAGRVDVDVDGLVDRLLTEVAPLLAPRITDTVALLHDALAGGARILLEGAQATFLDIDHGTYPFVTSSNPTAGFASVGSGLGPRDISEVIGVAKAYSTRVGSGPYPTELFDDIGDLLVERGREFGTNTGRRRRTGWFDAVMVRQAARLNSLSEIAITKLDILDTLPTIKLCVAYELDGQHIRHLPGDSDDFARATPVYIEMPGWQCDISAARTPADLPEAARNYLACIEREVGVPIRLVGTGPGRDEILIWETPS